MGKRFEKRLDREMRFHLDEAIEAYIEKGLPPEEARRRALIDFGALELAKDEMRDLHPLHWVEEIGRDLRYAIRQLRKGPAFTVTILLTLALCIGANTAIFSIVDQLFFEPPPYPHPERLMVAANLMHGKPAGDYLAESAAVWSAIRDHATLVDSAVSSADSSGINLFSDGQSAYVQQERVSAGFFRVLGVPPLLGREFTRLEDVPHGPSLTVISYSLWQRVFHGDRSIIGRSVELRGAPCTVIGVMPANFRSDVPVDLWTPLQLSGHGTDPNFEIFARLKPSVTLSDANAQLASIINSIHGSLDLQLGQSVAFTSLQSGLTAELRQQAKLMWVAVILVLLIGCINIAGILLARSTARSREIATRLALGASRIAVVKQLFAESLLLAIGGCALGLCTAAFSIELIHHLSADRFDIWHEPKLNPHVVLVTVLIAALTSIAFGLFPALEATAVDLRSALAEAGRSMSATRRQRKRQALVFAEVSLGVVLAITAGLLLRTLTALLNLDPGFNSNHVLTASLSMEDARYQTAASGAQLFQNTLERIRQIPGIESAGVTLALPYQRPLYLGVQVGSIGRSASIAYATPGFFKALQIHLLRGRLFSDRDNATSTPVAVVNQAFVDHFFSEHSNPIGAQANIARRLKVAIVGVVHNIVEKEDFGFSGALSTQPMMYIPASQTPDQIFRIAHIWFSPSFVVRTHRTIPNLEQKMREAILSVDPQLPFSAFHTIPELRSNAIAPQRYRAALFSAFAGLAILLCALGAYGLIAQSVAQRTREFGIRLALGATTQDILRNAILPGIKLSSAGIVCGVVFSIFATRLLKSLVWGVTTTDPATFLTVALLLLAVAALASLIPAQRVFKVDPAQTLRDA